MNVDSGDSSIPRGKLQPTACRDVFWVILFYAHLGGIGCATYLYGPMVVTDLASEYVGDANRYLEEQEDTLMEIDTMMYVLAASGLAGFVISSLAMSLMLAIPTTMIKMALVLNLIVTTAVFGFSIFIGAIGVAIMAGVGLLLTIYYTYVVWKRIPFAASTLVTALTAVKCNMGLAFFCLQQSDCYLCLGNLVVDRLCRYFLRHWGLQRGGILRERDQWVPGVCVPGQFLLDGPGGKERGPRHGGRNGWYLVVRAGRS